MLNDITIVKCEVMSHLVRLRGKDTVQRAHCAMLMMMIGGGVILGQSLDKKSRHVFELLKGFCHLETGERTKSLEYGKCLETGEMTKSLEKSLFQGILSFYCF